VRPSLRLFVLATLASACGSSAPDIPTPTSPPALTPNEVRFSATVTPSATRPGDPFAHQTQFASPLSVADAEQILVRTTWFETGNQPPKRQILALHRILDQPNAEARFESIASQAGPAGKLYALCGLIALKSPKAVGLEEQLKRRPFTVDVFEFDVPTEKTVSRIIAEIHERPLVSEFQRFRAETRALLEGNTPVNTADRDATIALYRERLGAVQERERFSIEDAYQALVWMSNALLQPQLPDATGSGKRGTTLLESLSDADFVALQKSLPGVQLGRVETISAYPDIPFWTQLAKAHGVDVDRAFFATLASTRQPSGWPTYIERQTDYSGCTRFGSMTLVETYRAWSAFDDKFFGYAEAARSELRAVGDAIATSTCACGDPAGVIKELDAFVREFPVNDFRLAAERRRDEVKAGRSNVRMKCKSG
jgi:hypothetical protein